jgi:hypothetical protein
MCRRCDQASAVLQKRAGRVGASMDSGREAGGPLTPAFRWREKRYAAKIKILSHMVVGRVYGIKTPEGTLVYIGSSTMPSRMVGPMPVGAVESKELRVHAIGDGNILEIIWSNRTSTTLYFTPADGNSSSVELFGTKGLPQAEVQAWRMAATY